MKENFVVGLILVVSLILAVPVGACAAALMGGDLFTLVGFPMMFFIVFVCAGFKLTGS